MRSRCYEWFLKELNKAMKFLQNLSGAFSLNPLHDPIEPPGVIAFAAWAASIEYNNRPGHYFFSLEDGNVSCPIFCDNSVTFMGKCLKPQDLENILFGFGSYIWGLSHEEAHGGQDAFGKYI